MTEENKGILNRILLVFIYPVTIVIMATVIAPLLYWIITGINPFQTWEDVLRKHYF